MQKINMEMVKSILPLRDKDSHKGIYGTLLCVCSSKSMPGAVVMSSNAAQMCGVGIINIALPKSAYFSVSSHLVEPIYTILNEDKDGLISIDNKDKINLKLKESSACLVGCGLGKSKDTQKIVYEIIEKSNIPLVIDADGINAISKNINILEKAKAPIIITPHPGEMSRLLNVPILEIQRDRLKYAKEISCKYNIITVLKGHETIICDENGNVFINETGNPGMAKGGSGDVLAGMISSFLAQKINPLDACVCSVYLHGLAGDRCAKKFSQIAMKPTNIIDELPNIFLEIERDRGI